MSASSDQPTRTWAAPASAVVLWGPVAAYCLAIFLLSSSSNLPDLPRGFSDKSAHLLLYSGLGFLVARAVAGGVGRPFPGWTIGVAVIVSVLYGLTDETHQLFVPHRQFDMMDLAADVIGATAGAACCGCGV